MFQPINGISNVTVFTLRHACTNLTQLHSIIKPVISETYIDAYQIMWSRYGGKEK